jgi:hypothetical protein
MLADHVPEHLNERSFLFRIEMLEELALILVRQPYYPGLSKQAAHRLLSRRAFRVVCQCVNEI